jgi:WD40 repeat protein
MKRIRVLTIVVLFLTSFFMILKSASSDLAECFGNNIRPAVTNEAIPDIQLLSTKLMPITLDNATRIMAVNTYDNNTDTVYAVFDAGGNALVSGDSKTFRIIDLTDQTEETLKIEDNSFILRAAFDTESTPIMLSSALNSFNPSQAYFRLTDTKTKQDIAYLPLAYRETVNDIKFTPNNKCVAFASSYSKIRIWNVLTKTEKTLNARNHVTSVAFSADGKHLAYGTDGDNDSSGEVAIAILDLENDKEIASFKGHATTITKVLFSHDGKIIASSSWDKTIRLWDVATGKELFILNGHTDGVTDFTFSDDDKLIASVSRDSTIRLWDASTGKQISVLNAQVPLIGISFKTNMQSLISIAKNGNVDYWGINPINQ